MRCKVVVCVLFANDAVFGNWVRFLLRGARFNFVDDALFFNWILTFRLLETFLIDDFIGNWVVNIFIWILPVLVWHLLAAAPFASTADLLMLGRVSAAGDVLSHFFLRNRFFLWHGVWEVDRVFLFNGGVCAGNILAINFLLVLSTVRISFSWATFLLLQAFGLIVGGNDTIALGKDRDQTQRIGVRCGFFLATGMEEILELLGDGLALLRFNMTTATFSDNLSDFIGTNWVRKPNFLS